MSKEKREFTGVFIPAHIWVSKELIPAEKMLLGEIEALSKRTGWCEASREHFAEWLQCAVQNITYYFNKLEKSGFLEVVRTPGKRSKSRVVSAKFYTNEEVNPIYPTRKPHLPPPVNPIYPTRKPHLPEIQLKDKSKNKSVPRAENSPTLKTETPHVENESPAARPGGNLSAWVQNLTADYRIKEAFQRGYRIPDHLFEEYATRFSAVAAVDNKYHSQGDFNRHFLSWSATQYEKVKAGKGPASTTQSGQVYVKPKNLITA